MKLDLLTNATVLNYAIRFVSRAPKEKLKSSYSSSNEDNKESKQPDYDESPRRRGWRDNDIINDY
jgi:hypothetical protein